MMATDLTRFAALITIPAAYALGRLSLGQLVAVSVVVAVAKIAFNAASGANLKALGGAAVGLLGPVTTALADAVSYLLSACGIAAVRNDEPIRNQEEGQVRPRPFGMRLDDLLDGWRGIALSPALRPVFFNSVLTGGLILATEPLLAVLLLGPLGFAPWQYTVAFGAPCVGGFIGSRVVGRLAARHGRHRIMRVFGVLRVCWPVGLAFTAAYRLDHTPKDRVARTLAAWSTSSSLAIAGLTALWSLLASLAGVRVAIAAAGVLLRGTPLLLPRREYPPLPSEAAEVAGRVTAG